MSITDSLAVRRVHWFRTSALCKRWWEEEKLLREEMCRTVRFFVFYRTWWSARADRENVLGDRCSSPYARKYVVL